jgi:hypothetical protein
MTVARCPQTVKKVGARLFWTVLTLMAIRASTYTGLQLFELVDGTSYHTMFVNGARTTSHSIGVLGSMDPVLGMLLVPGLIVATLVMGGLILWNRKNR